MLYALRAGDGSDARRDVLCVEPATSRAPAHASPPIVDFLGKVPTALTHNSVEGYAQHSANRNPL